MHWAELVIQREQEREKLKAEKESWRCKERRKTIFTKLRIMKFSELPVAVLESYQQAQTDISKLSFLLSFTSIPLYTPLYTSGRSSKLHNPQDPHIFFKTIALALQYPRPTQHDQTSTPWWGKGCIFWWLSNIADIAWPVLVTSRPLNSRQRFSLQISLFVACGRPALVARILHHACRFEVPEHSCR